MSSRFTLLRKLGSGGFGAVFEALDRARGQRVALKKLVRMDPAAIYRFKQEFRALAEVRHPNLVRLHELFCDDGEWYLTMDLVDGDDLHVWLRAGASPAAPRPETAAPEPMADEATQPFDQRTTAPSLAPPPPSSPPAPSRGAPWRLDEARIRAVFPQIALGVQALHEARWLHRDLKPSNAMVTTDGHAVLLDFGLVASTQADAQPSFDHEVLGTPTYMSPEQACDGPVTAASDWYAVGVMLYEALTGAAPFTGSMFQVLHHKCTREPDDPRRTRPGLPDDLVELCLALLSLDPERRPSGAEVLRRLAPERAPVETPASRSRELPFVGRSRHLDVLRARLAESRAGRATYVEVSGRSGMGKSALARHFLAELAADPDAVVLRGRCHAHEAVPYKAFDGVVDGLTRHLHTLGEARASVIPDDAIAVLARLFPAFARLPRDGRDEPPPARDAGELRRLAFAALQRGLARLAARGTVAVVLDDLQWGDADSAALLIALLAPPTAPPVLLVACHRTEESAAGPMLRLLRDARDRGALAEPSVLEVGPLDDDDAFALARALLPEAPEASVRAVVREAGGNALFVRELARTVASGGAAEGSLTLAGVLGERVERLPPDARTLLGLVALAGHPLDERLARDAASLDAIAFDRALRVLLTAQLLRSGGAGARSTLEARHDAIRDAALVGLSPESLAALHRSLARVLAVDPHTEPDALALHLRALGEHVEAQRLDELAGDRAADALAFDRAAVLYRRALTPGAPPHARDLRVKLGDALAHAGVGGEAARSYLLAAADSAPAAALELEQRAAEQLLRSGHVDEGVEVIRTVLDALGMSFPETPAAAQASLDARRASLDANGDGAAPAGDGAGDPEDLARLEVCWSVGNGLGGVSPVVGADFHARHVELALRGGDPYQVARALSWGAMLAAMEGGAGAQRAETLAERAEEMAERAGHPHGLGWSVAAAAVTAFCEGRWRRAAQLAEYGAALFRERCVDVAWELGELEVRWQLPACAYRGEITLLAERAAQAAREAAARGDRYNLTNVRTTLLPLVHLAHDQAREARRGVEEAIASWSSSGFHLQHANAGLALAMVDLYAGKPARALAGLTALRRELETARLLGLLTVRATWHHLRGLAAAGAAAGASGAARRAHLRQAIASARALRSEGREWTDGLALSVAGAAHLARGGAARAESAWRRAEAQFAAMEMALHAGAARRAVARLTGDDAAVEAAERAMAARGVVAPARWSALVTGEG